MKEDIKFQTYLIPERFFDLINSGKTIEGVEFNEEKNGKFYHRLIYNKTVFVTDTEKEVYEL